MNFKEAARLAHLMQGRRIARVSEPEDELVSIDYNGSGKRLDVPTLGIINRDTNSYTTPDASHSASTDWEVSQHHVEVMVRTLGDELRMAAAANVPFTVEMRERVARLGDADRLRLWSYVTRRGINIDAIKTVYQLMVHFVMEVFKVPMGDAGMGVEPTISDEVKQLDAEARARKK